MVILPFRELQPSLGVGKSVANYCGSPGSAWVGIQGTCGESNPNYVGFDSGKLENAEWPAKLAAFLKYFSTKYM
jgi:hypothetical protein